MQKTLSTLGNQVAILGTQWGDEGKGKLVDAVSPEFDVICRSTGGANAGHTIWSNGTKYVFHLLPSGLLHPNSIGVVGNGCVIDIQEFWNEVISLESQNLQVRERVKISLKAHLLLPYHKKIDQALEIRKGNDKIGTTCRGIGPCYQDKVARIGIRLEDLLDLDRLKEKITKNAIFHSQCLNIEIDPEEEYQAVLAVRDNIKPLLCDVSEFLIDQIKAGKKILYEGAQAHHLDIDHGTYPYVTSSNVSLGGVCTGLGVPPQAISGVIGITKAYTTRVGEGPFPAELENDLGEQIRSQGAEFGATTGRPRRCGWLDTVMLKKTVQINGVTTINLTKLDVLTGIPEIKIVTGYRLDGNPISEIPTTPKALKKLEMIQESLPGWTEELTGTKSFEDLPPNAQKYVHRIEELVECPINIIGVGVDRDDLLFC